MGIGLRRVKRFTTAWPDTARVFVNSAGLPALLGSNRLAGPLGRCEMDFDVHFLNSFTLLAAQPSVGDRVRVIPGQVWLNLGICVVALIVLVRVWRGLKQFNEFAPHFATAFACFMILFFWVYHRSEPRFLTPVVEKLTYFFPTRSKSEQDLERMRRSLKEP